MADPFEVKKRTPWTPWDTGRDVSNFFKARSARKQGMTIKRPSGETVFQAPQTLVTPFGTPIPASWDELKFVDKRYGDVIQVMAQSGSPDLYKIALKSRTNEPLSPEEVMMINEAWKILMEESYRETPKGIYAWSPEKRAFEISQAGKPKGFTSEDRYQLGRQQAETQFIEKRSEENQKRVAEQEKRMREMESKRQALKGPRDWMRYMIEIGEKPSWLGYWLAKRT